MSVKYLHENFEGQAALASKGGYISLKEPLARFHQIECADT